MKLEMTLRIPFYSTENREKIETALVNLFGEIPELIEQKEENLSFLTSNKLEINSLRIFFNYIRRNEIIDTVRKCTLIYPSEGNIIFNFHKQALMVEKIVVITPDTSSPLGSVELTIHTQNIEKFLNWLVPKTHEGKILKPKKFNDIFNL